MARNNIPFVTIFSLSRCGSTSIYRALNLHRACKLVYEPDFSKDGEAGILDSYQNLRTEYTGMKHVWDPSGFPFRKEHRSEVTDLEEHCEKWISLNELLLSIPNQKILFLTRRDETSRIVSDLLGQATDIWGPESNASHSREVGAEYLQKISESAMVNLPIDTLRWYCDNIPKLNRRLHIAAEKNPVIDVHYEDLFGSKVSKEKKMDEFNSILEFLELKSNILNISLNKVATIFAPSGKLNSVETYKRIQNIEIIKQEIGWVIPSE